MKDSANHNKTKVSRTFSLKSLRNGMTAIVFCLTVIFGAQMANAATYTVSNNDDNGDGSFRAAINLANNNSTLDTILFSSSVTTIMPLTPLPLITQPVIIDASVNGQQAAAPRVELSGVMTARSFGATTNDQFGLQIAASAAGSTIRGLIINRFGNAGIKTAANNTTILQNIIGTNLDGAQGLGNVNQGILIVGSTGNVIGGTNNLDNSLPRNVISGNQGAGIAIMRGGAATIINNYIGVAQNGTADLGNTFDGILIAESSNSIIGGITAAERNVISGNNGNGVYIAQNIAAIPASGNIIQGNYIGVNATGVGDGTTGNSMVGNDGSGVVIEAGGNTVGGNTTGARNIISGNRSNGVSLGTNFATANKVTANFIGVSANFTGVASDTTVVRNRLNGVQISNLASNNKVGGTDTGAGVCNNSCNVIANNGDVNANTGRAGIYLDSSAGRSNSFQRNSIFSNTELGIDLAVPSSSTDMAFIPGTGTTPNDAGDPDTGANDLQNFPVLTAADTNGVVTGTLNSTSNTKFAVDFYRNAAPDTAVTSEARTFIGTIAVTTDNNGNATINFNAGTSLLTAGQFVTATATSISGSAQAVGDTSEISDSRVVTAATGASPGIEADIAPRSRGDNAHKADDLIQLRRFLNGADTPDTTTNNEFQRADSAPYDSRGDGALCASDLIQLRRYINGADASQPAGGPTSQTGSCGAAAAPAVVETSEAAATDTGDGSRNSEGQIGDSSAATTTAVQAEAAVVARELRVESTSASAGQMVTVNIRVDALGDEAAYAFKLNYDQAVLTNPVIALSTGGGSTGASITCDRSVMNRIGCTAEGFPNNRAGSSRDDIGEILPDDNQLLVSIRFTVAQGAQPQTVPLTLTDVSSSNDLAQGQAITSTNGTVTINGTTAASVVVGGRLSSSKGRGVANAQVTLTDTRGEVRVTRSNSYGYFKFTDVMAGESYVIAVKSKQYRFASQVINVVEDLDEVNLTAEARN